jgi:hypothetical protein
MVKKECWLINSLIDRPAQPEALRKINNQQLKLPQPASSCGHLAKIHTAS